MAKRRSASEMFLDQLNEMVEEAMAKSNPHLPEEADRIKRALVAKVVRMGSDETRAEMRELIDQIWNDLEKKRQGGRVSSGGPRRAASKPRRASAKKKSRKAKKE